MKFIDKHGFILTLSNETELSVDEAKELINKRQVFYDRKIRFNLMNNSLIL